MHSLTKKAFAEMLGTFVLVFFACGTAIVSGVDLVATALAFGLVIVAMAYAIGGISGCHINPAVSLGMLICKKMTPKEFLVYVCAQIVGALIGAAALYGILSLGGMDLTAVNVGFATNNVIGAADTSAYIASILLETVLTFVFVYAILGVTSKSENKSATGIVIGLTLTLVHLLGIGLTGTSVNPARSFGTALMALIFGGGSTALAEVWVFIVAPLLGAALAAVVFMFLNRHKNEENATEVSKRTKK